MEDLKKLTEWVWATYLGDNEERYQELLQRFDKSATVIGTGKQEIYTSLEAFLAEAGNELREREGIHFHLRDFWCEEQSLGPDHSLIYGGVYVWWESPDHRISIRMDSRFTMVYRRVEGEWRIFHVHQSVPNPEQMEGETFPKTLTQQMDSARREIDSLSRLADTDSLTGLLNLRGLQQRYEQVDDASYWLMMLDIDNFKQTNDCYGHLAGNQALIDLAAILNTVVRGEDSVCRVGGDEFVLLCHGLRRQDAESLAQRLIDRVAVCARADRLLTGISVGLTRAVVGERMEDALSRADRALYLSKEKGKNCYTVG